MNTLEVKRFFDGKVANDAKLQQALDASTRLEEVVQVAGEQGFRFSIKELKEYLQEPSKGELSLDDLGQVAGGLMTPPQFQFGASSLRPGLRNVQVWLRR